MKRRVFTFLIFFLISFWSRAQLFNWVAKGGGSAGDQGWAVARDISGNVFVTGGFTGTAVFGS